MLNILEQQKTILVIGDIMLDVALLGKVARHAPDAPVSVVKTLLRNKRLGGAANVALNLRSLGAKVILAGFVGDDESSIEVEKLLLENSIATRLLKFKNAVTITKTSIIGENLDGERQKLLRVDDEESFSDHNDYAQYQQHFLNVLSADIELVDAVVISDYLKGTCSTQICEFIIQKARELNIPVIVDPKGNDWEKYRNATLIKPNFQELCKLLGKDIADDSDIIEKIVKDVIKKFNLEHLVVTRGHNGLLHVCNSEKTEMPAFAKQAIDPTGAGDTVIASLALSLAAEHPNVEMLYFASYAAQSVVTKSGTKSASLEEILSLYLLRTKQEQKLIEIDQVANLMQILRYLNKKIVFTNGVFNTIHNGHMRHFEQAKELGDILLVGLNSDSSIRNLKGGDGFNYNAFADRYAMLNRLDEIDYVIKFDEITPVDILKIIRPDIIIKGGNYTIDEIVGKEYAKEALILSYNEKIQN